APAARQHERGEHDSREGDAEKAKTRRTPTVHGGLLPATLRLPWAGRPSDAKKALLALFRRGLGARVVGGVHVGDAPRSHSVQLDDGLAFGHREVGLLGG